jgi:CRISPR-associated endonuclease/helicase Cas3
VKTFEELFREATGYPPHGYQARIARGGLPDVLQAPTAAGKTGVILAWLWRRLYGPDPGRSPRRLIYALPQRSLTDHVSGEVRRWLAILGLTDEVTLHVAMGARGETRGEWREDMHKPAIVVGTADVLVSKALNRAFGMDRAIFPIDFALTVNGAHWVIDEVQLSPQTATTLRQLAGFAAENGTAEPFGLSIMSATVPDELLGITDNSEFKKRIQILDSERTGALAIRLAATRTVRRLPTAPGDYHAMAAAVRERHRPGTLTLVVINTVDAARHLYRQLRGGVPDCTLLHSRFRGIERAERLAGLIGQSDEPGHSLGRIVVTTQVVEAGVDLDAALLVTEAAPWSSLIQRAGRCNRGGLRNADAEVCWVPPPSPFPYEQADIDATVRELGRLEGARLTTEDLMAREVDQNPSPLSVIGRADLARLFDTSSDRAGSDADVAAYVRDAEDLDAEVAWATWTPGEDGMPDPEIRVPAVEYRCRVPIGAVVALARDRAVWRFDRSPGGWTRVDEQSQSRPRPGEVLLLSAADGGYDVETGFDPSAPGPVPGSPKLLTPTELTDRLAAQAAMQAELAEAVADDEDAAAAGQADAEPRRWQSLDEHSSQVRDQAAALLAAMAPPGVPAATARGAIVAGYLHDVGKAHEIWQDAICALAEEGERAEIAAGRPWAKSGGKGGALLFAGGVAFRHELASLLLIDGPLSALLAESPDPDLTRYLVLAHHGKLRVQVREHHAVGSTTPTTPAAQSAANGIRGLRPGAATAIPAMLGRPAGTLTVDLDQFQPAGDGSSNAWSQTVLGLRDRYGPFVLAYLETLVRVADWRASGGRELPVA